MPKFCLRKQGLSVPNTSFQSEHCPSGIYSPGTYSGSLPPSSGDIVNPVSRRLANTSSRPVSVITHTEHGRPQVINKAKSELHVEPVQNIQFLGLQLHLDQGRASLPISKAREIIAHTCPTSSQKILSYTEVSQFMGSLNWALGLFPLGRLYLRPLQRHFHSLGLTSRFTPLCRSDPLVLATLLRQWQDLSFLMSEIPIRPFQTEFTIFKDTSTKGLGAHLEIPRLRMFGPIQNTSSTSMYWSSRH